MKPLRLSIIITIIFFSCGPAPDNTDPGTEQTKFVISTWTNAGDPFDSINWHKKLKDYSSLGISEILVGGNPEFLPSIIKMAGEHNIKVHAWMWTLNQPGDSIAMQHPEWYSVNRNGKNSLDYRPYVNYYQWLSPFHPGARNHIINKAKKILDIEGIASLHLDYVRYVDVILGDALQPKYELDQDHQMPEFDFGYHPIARKQFKAQFDVDPIAIKYPDQSTEWLQFRLNAVTSLVNEIAEIAQTQGQELSAAVFPFPTMSRIMVRQAWDDWHLDRAYPMLYHNFYNQKVEWIDFALKQGMADVDFPVYPGIYIPGFSSMEDLDRAFRIARDNGAPGISLFTADNLSDEQKAVVRRYFE